MNYPILQRTLSLLLFGTMMLSAVGYCGDEDPGRFYVGAGLGIADASKDEILTDGNGTALKALVGYRFNSSFSVEGTVIAFDDFKAANPLVPHAHRAFADGSGFNASAVLLVPVSERVSITGRAGVLFWPTGSDLGYIDDSGTDASFGVGVIVRLTDALDLRADYELLTFGDTDVTTATASLVYSFGGRSE